MASTSNHQRQPVPVPAVGADPGAEAAAAPVGILRNKGKTSTTSHDAADAAATASSDGAVRTNGDDSSQAAHVLVQVVSDKPAAPVDAVPPQPEILCDGAAESELAALMLPSTSSSRTSRRAEGSLVPSRRGFPPTLLRRLFLTECNSYCVDCGRREDGIPDKLTTFAASAPSRANSVDDVKMRLAWANVNYGTVLCGRCALQHHAVEGDNEVRNFGTSAAWIPGSCWWCSTVSLFSQPHVLNFPIQTRTHHTSDRNPPSST
jgi:hypothetical protein